MLRDSFELTVVEYLLEAQVGSPQFAFQDVAAELTTPVSPVLADRMPDAASCFARNREVEPVFARDLAVAGLDFDRVSVGQLRPQRNLLPVHTSPSAMTPDFAVDRVGEVDRRRF